MTRFATFALFATINLLGCDGQPCLDEVYTIPSDTGGENDTADTDNDDITDTGTPAEQDKRLYLKTADMSTVWYIDDSGERYTFPFEAVFYTWEETNDVVITVNASIVANIPLAGNMPVKPGTIMVKIKSDKTIYWVEEVIDDPYNPALRPIDNEEVAKALAGPDWAMRVLDIPDVFFVDYEYFGTTPVTMDNYSQIDTSNLLYLSDLQE